MINRALLAGRDIASRIKNNPDYGWSIATSYGQIGLNIFVQILLVPLYLHHLGKVEFGVLMIMLMRPSASWGNFRPKMRTKTLNAPIH